DMLSGILTIGGTILRTSRHKPNKMPVGKKLVDMTDAIVENYHKHQLAALICIGGGGTHKSALLLKKAGLNIVTIPKTIDNDLSGSSGTIGFDTALNVATDAIDSLHSTASSHKRIMLVEVMGHKTGWLTLGSGIAGGADVILIPEIPYSLDKVADALKLRSREGKLFSIVPVAEGAVDKATAEKIAKLQQNLEKCTDKKRKAEIKAELAELTSYKPERIFELAKKLETLTTLETRVTILGYLQRGGTPSCFDRMLATQLGVRAAEAVLNEEFGFMAAYEHGATKLVPIEEVAGKRKELSVDHPWVKSAKESGISFGA
ncbi:MAG: ATP-dependent 6-phosphofructokinase, partial [Lentisphaeria bacterium]|nr:ATP-dependent 6-phosphofructokinase [Lentisphaeria bacterium]